MTNPTTRVETVEPLRQVFDDEGNFAKGSDGKPGIIGKPFHRIIISQPGFADVQIYGAHCAGEDMRPVLEFMAQTVEDHPQLLRRIEELENELAHYKWAYYRDSD